MVSMALWVSAGVAFLNILLSLILLTVYVRNYRSIKSYFTAGLIIFSLLFLLLNLAIVGLWFFLFTNLPLAETLIDQAMLFILMINLAESAGLATLIVITLR